MVSDTDYWTTARLPARTAGWYIYGQAPVDTERRRPSYCRRPPKDDEYV